MSKSVNNELQQKLQRLLNDLQLEDAPAGGSVVVYQAGEFVAAASIGQAQSNEQSNDKWQADTLALNFSTGKGVLATLAHVLVSEGMLAYDEPIASYWPEFAANGKAKITLRKLMSHQASLFAISAIDVDNATLLDWPRMLEEVAAMPINEIDAADQFVSAYSALVYGWILGGLIEKATDMTLAAALGKYLTEPLGIAGSCYFGVPADQVDKVAKLAKDFINTATENRSLPTRRHKPVLKAESEQTLAAYRQLPSYECWQQLADEKKSISPADKKQHVTSLTATKINRLYFDHSAINASNYRAALVPASKQPIDYYDAQTLQAVIPAANGVASAQALATIYAMLANGGVWQGKTLIDAETFAQLSEPQVLGMDAVMPASMNWRLGYHKLFSICQSSDDSVTPSTEQGFGHMGYNGSVAWCEPSRQLSFAFIHNFDVTMLNDIRQFALTEAVIKMIDTQD
ncbi:serine hydrolase [uncultured Psychrobacter sp.]|uniref:serine hydrolase domain-containing protein n=1 Tax=uncultured Psychrobacter sp. TaxID=259303 RepID=UPI0026048175|nr:serine hydrolase domain-containing protein [uncultured Psychrobacter sp.]